MTEENQPIEVEQFHAFTFMFKQKVLKKHYVKFFGTHRSARHQMLNAFGTEWAFQYDESHFAGQAEEYDMTELLPEQFEEYLTKQREQDEADRLEDLE